MVLVKWLTGEWTRFDTVMTVCDLSQKLRGRNQKVQLFSIEPDKDHSMYTDPEHLLAVDDHVGVVITPEVQLTPAEDERVRSAFRFHIGSDLSFCFEEFNQLIIDHRALVAGGSVVGALTGTVINDFDIYVNRSSAKALVKAFLDHGLKFRDSSVHVASTYDQSFFRRNRILIRIPMFVKHFIVDILVIPDNVTCESVVTNFDLSFCETWWNGEHVFAADPDGVRGKAGILKPDYLECLVRENNKFILRRIKKYRNRGFLVDVFGADVSNSDVADMVRKASESSQPSPWQAVPNEAWAVSFFLRNLFTNLYTFSFYHHENLNRNVPRVNYTKLLVFMFFSLFPQEFSVDCLRSMWSDRLPSLSQLVKHVDPSQELYIPSLFRTKFAEVFQVELSQNDIFNYEHDLLRLYEYVKESF